MELVDLKRLLVETDPADFVQHYVIEPPAPHFSDEQLEDVRTRVSTATGIAIAKDEICIVGSAKLGFGLFEKSRKAQGLPDLPAFRPFGPESDIDVAFVSPTLFDHIWEEISAFALTKPVMPHRMSKLGDYLVYGWLRPDHFPREVRLRRFDRWNDTIRSLPRLPIYQRRKISGAVYRSMDFMKRYQARGIASCQRTLTSP